jgi:hypothetical protein
MVAAGFVGSLAAPLSNTGDPVQLAETGTISQIIRVRQADGTYQDVNLSDVARAVAYQESKRDSGSLDIDRTPLATQPNATDFHPNAEDSDFGDPATLMTVAGDGSAGLPFLIRPYGLLSVQEQQEFVSDISAGMFALYEPPTVGGVPNPERFRAFVTLGGHVFGTAPSKVGDMVLQAGRTEE